MSGAWKVAVVRPSDNAELALIVVAEGYTDAVDAAREMCQKFGISTTETTLGAVVRLY